MPGISSLHMVGCVQGGKWGLGVPGISMVGCVLGGKVGIGSAWYPHGGVCA